MNFIGEHATYIVELPILDKEPFFVDDGSGRHVSLKELVALEPRLAPAIVGYLCGIAGSRTGVAMLSPAVAREVLALDPDEEYLPVIEELADLEAPLE